jgi:hypothetical protein
MPAGIGLNVNVPPFTAGSGTTLPFAVTQVGLATAYAPAFFAKLSDSPLAVGAGVNLPLPGISLAPMGSVLPSGNTLPQDADAKSEGNTIARGGVVAISPVQGVPEASQRFEAWVRARICR